MIETAWLVERRDRGSIEYLAAGLGMFEWTGDSLKGVRFCRREDANAIGELFDDLDIHICEHQWDDIGTGVAPETRPSSK